MTWLHDFLANQATAQSAGNGEVYPPIRTGPQSAIRATSPASPYARDRIEAPSNRPAPRTPTLRSRTQDVIRSAPGALTAARERQVYDTTWEDVGRGAQEMTGLPALARGAGGLAALPALARSGFLSTEHALPIAGAVAETALGLAGPMSIPRGAPRGALRAPEAPVAAPMQRVPRQSAPAGNALTRPLRTGLASDDVIRRTFAGVSSPEARRSAQGVSLVERGDPVFEEGVRRYRGTDGVYIDIIPDEAGVAQVQFSLGPEARNNNIANALRDVSVAIQRDMDANGERVYSMLGGTPAHDRVYRQIMESGAFDPGPNYDLRMNSGAELGDRARALGEVVTGRARPSDYDADYILRGPQGQDRMPFLEMRRRAVPRVSGRGSQQPQLPNASNSAGALEPAQRIPNMAREIGPNGMPVAQSQPTRNSFRGGSSDLREAAGMGAVQRLDDPQGRGFITYRESPDGWQVRQSRVLGEHRGQGVGTQLYSDLIERARAAGAPRITSDVTVSEDAARVYDSLQRRGYPVQRSERFEPGALHSRPPFSIDLTRPRAPPPTTPTGTAPFGDPRAYPPQAWDDFGSLQGGAPEARGGGAGGGNASVGQSLRGFHGSPRSGLTSVSANPEARQFDNATSQFGAFVSPTRQGAQRYGENVYDVSVDLRRPYEMDLAEFNRFQAPNRGANGEALPGEMWQQRMAELKQEATALRERLAQEGYDGVIVRNRNGEPTEIASFSDIPLGNPPQPLLGGTPEARLRAQEQGFDTGRVLYHGTASAFDEIRPGRRGGQVYLTGDPEIAGIYADSARSRWPGQNNADPNIVPVFARTPNPLVVSDLGPSGDHGWLHDSIAEALNLPSSTSARQLRAEAAARGYDSIEARNMLDLGGEQTQLMVFDPRNIRSIFAAFDPAKRDSSDLLAGLTAATPIPIAATALTQQQNTTGRSNRRPGLFGGR